MDWDKEFDDIYTTKEYRQEMLLLDFLEIISKYLLENNMTKSDLAKRLKISNAAVTKMLSGRENLSIKRMASIACDLGISIGIHQQNYATIDGLKENFEKGYFFTELQQEEMNVAVSNNIIYSEHFLAAC